MHVAQCWNYKANDYYWSKNGTKQEKVKMRNFLLNYLHYFQELELNNDL